MRQLSKSKIIAFRQCPKRLWLDLHRPDLKDDSGNESAFAIGSHVGGIARKIYDPENTGLSIDVDDLGWEQAFERTASWLAGRQAPLFEAAFRIPGALALADVMLPVGEEHETRWRLVEVKSSTRVKDHQRDDIAIQAFVARRAGVPLAGVSLAHIDRDFVYQGSGNYQGLLVVTDFTEETLARHDEVAEWLAGAQVVAAEESEPDVAPGPQCSAPFECAFWEYCHRDLPTTDYPLSSFSRLDAGKMARLEAAGCHDVRDVPDAELSEVNLLIKRQTLKGETYFDEEGAAADLAHCGFPALFLDFETISFSVPVWTGTRPYQLIPFEFSLHRLSRDGSLSHESFLDLSGTDPSEKFLNELIRVCDGEGPVFVYNATFENRVMGDLARRFPARADALAAISERVVDLLPIARNRFYAPSQHGMTEQSCLPEPAVV